MRRKKTLAALAVLAVLAAGAAASAAAGWLHVTVMPSAETYGVVVGTPAHHLNAYMVGGGLDVNTDQ